MLKLYGCGSPNVFKVQLLLAELGLDHAFEAVPLYGDALRGAEFRALNPNGRLPVLVDAERQQGRGGTKPVRRAGQVDGAILSLTRRRWAWAGRRLRLPRCRAAPRPDISRWRSRNRGFR